MWCKNPICYSVPTVSDISLQVISSSNDVYSLIKITNHYPKIPQKISKEPMAFWFYYSEQVYWLKQKRV